MDLETFQSLPTEEVARLVREAGPKVCCFPIKGTRRWFAMERPSLGGEDFASAYVGPVTKRSIELFRMIFDHGLDTLLTPCLDQPEMERGDQYLQVAADALARLATHTDFLHFYSAHGVRVRFYGDYRKALGATSHSYLPGLFDQVTTQTQVHDRHRLFYGLFPHDTVEITGQLAVRHYREHGRTPDRRTLIEAYYGEHVGPVDLFIGFGKLRAFGMPLLDTGRADLYFTVSPSLYLTEQQLRRILYDHLYARGRTEVDLQPGDWLSMMDFYRANTGRTLGVGTRRGDAVWHPLPQVHLPWEIDQERQGSHTQWRG